MDVQHGGWQILLHGLVLILAGPCGAAHALSPARARRAHLVRHRRPAAQCTVGRDANPADLGRAGGRHWRGAVAGDAGAGDPYQRRYGADCSIGERDGGVTSRYIGTDVQPARSCSVGPLACNRQKPFRFVTLG